MASRSLGKYDLVISGEGLTLGFNLALEAGRPAVEPFELGPGRLDEVVRNADVPRVIDNLDAGMGFSRRMPDVPNGYGYTLPGYCRAPGGIFSPSGKITEITLPAGFSDWIIGSERFTTPAGTFIYLFTNGPHVLRLSADGMTATITHTFSPPCPANTWAVFKNRLYVAGGAGMAYLEGATGAWSAVFGTVLRSQLAVVNWRPLGVPTAVMVGIAPDPLVAGLWNAVRWCPITGEPTVDGDWSAPLRIGGDQRYSVNRLVAAPRHVYMLRPDGVWDMDELGAHAFNVAPWVDEAVDYFNGGWGIHVGDGLYYSHSQGLAFVPTSGEAQYSPEWCHPGWGLPYEGPVRGRVNTGTLHAGWGLAGMWSDSGVGGDTYVCAGRRAPDTAFGAASHVWHGAEAVLPGAVQHMRVYTFDWAGSWPNLFMSTVEGAGANVIRAYWQSLSKTGTPLQELLWGGGFQPADAGSLFLPADPWDRPSSVKTLLELEMTTERLDPGNRYLRAYASADGGDWADQGTAEDSPYASLVPLETTEGRFISVRVDAVGSPILRSLELRTAIGVTLREARTYRVILAWDNALKGATRGRETADPERRLWALQGLLGRVCTLEDASPGGPRRVRVLQVQSGERRRIGGAPRAGSNGAEGAWAIVVPITVSFLDRPFRWDGPPRTDVFDRDRTFA